MATSLNLGLPGSLGKWVSLGSANRNIGFLKQNLTCVSEERSGAREQLVPGSNQSSFTTHDFALRRDRTPHSGSACILHAEAKPHTLVTAEHQSYPLENIPEGSFSVIPLGD